MNERDFLTLAAALLRHDGPRVLEVLRQGLATPEHGAFVARLTGPPQQG